MPKFIIYILFLFLIYSCAPINKQHGYVVDDILYAMDNLDTIESIESNKEDVLKTFGSPSIKISDIDDVWIYLVSVKQENVFENDIINFQHIMRYQFDETDNVVKVDILNQNNFTEIAFSNEKTTITRDAYGISDQIYDAFTRGTAP